MNSIKVLPPSFKSAKDIKIPRMTVVPSLPTVPLNKLIEAFWRSDKQIHQICYHDRIANYFKNTPVNIKDATSLAQKNSDDGKETYFAPAEYNNPDNRTASNALGAFGFWVDLDVGVEKAETGKGYLTVEGAEAALLKFCSDAGIPLTTHKVNSGGGIHAYWVVNEFITRETWQNYATKIKFLAKSLGFLADPSRTNDIASVLRMPGTLNYKYNPPRPVILKSATDEYIDRDELLAAIDSACNRIYVTENLADKSNVHRHVSAVTAVSNMLETQHNVEIVQSALAVIDPDCEHQVWFKANCAICSLGWECGESIARAWSKGDYWKTTNQTANKYDERAFDIMWKSIRADAGISIGTLFHYAKEAGWVSTVHSQIEEFEACETIIIESKGQSNKQPETKQQSCASIVTNPLDKYSLRGRSAELEKNALDEVYMLDGIALQGEITVFFAAPNTGKTAISLRLLVNGITEGRVDPNKVYYLNMDDSSQGVIAKNRIAEQYNFHMLTEGFEGFSAIAFLPIMRGMVEKDQAHGVVIILDTLKKFADVMDNTKTSIFTSVLRAFVMRGGTVIALAHTNKNTNKAGKPQYGGVSSILADVDCAYTIAEASAIDCVKVVEFENIKRRGNVVQNVAYSYSIGNNIAYDDLLASVQSIDESQLNTLKRAEEIMSDAETIDIVLAFINKGINTKMELVDAFAKRAEMSQNAAIKFIGKYTGADIARHKWNFTVGARGAKTYVALNPGAPAA